MVWRRQSSDTAVSGTRQLIMAPINHTPLSLSPPPHPPTIDSHIPFAPRPLWLRGTYRRPRPYFNHPATRAHQCLPSLPLPTFRVRTFADGHQTPPLLFPDHASHSTPTCAYSACNHLLYTTTAVIDSPSPVVDIPARTKQLSPPLTLITFADYLYTARAQTVLYGLIARYLSRTSLSHRLIFGPKRSGQHPL